MDWQHGINRVHAWKLNQLLLYFLIIYYYILDESFFIFNDLFYRVKGLE